MHRISVIIPVYNAASFLERAINSVLIQDFICEIIMVEDGSSDNSYELCKIFSSRNKNIMVFQHDNGENRGPSESRNLGLKYAKGDWIQFLDADDELLPKKISHQISLISTDRPFIVANSINKFVDNSSSKRTFINEPWIGLISGKLGITSANLFNKEYLNAVGGFDESLYTSEEYDLMFRILKLNSNIIFDYQPLTLIHQTANSICRSGNNNEDLYINWVTLRKEIRRYLIKENLFSLKYRFWYSGYLGQFQKLFKKPLDQSINIFLLFLFDLQIIFKKGVYLLLKRIK